VSSWAIRRCELVTMACLESQKWAGQR